MSRRKDEIIIMRLNQYVIAIFWILIILLPSTVWAASVTLNWQPNPEADIKGYHIYYGTASRKYSQPIPVGKVTKYTVTGLKTGTTYYFAITAVDTSGNESGYSTEIRNTIPATRSIPSISLPNSGSYGNISGGDQNHVDNVRYSFPGARGDFIVTYRAWDIDSANEVKIRLNGTDMGFVPRTRDKSWGGSFSMRFNDNNVHDSRENVLVFSNIHNPPKTVLWGVKDVKVVRTSSWKYPITLPANGAYGRIKNGDQAHVDKVVFSFSGKRGDVSLSYQAWDIDFENEVRVFLNGNEASFIVPKTGNETWSRTRTITLKDTDVNDDGVNRVTFTNTSNPPKTYWWGVRNLSVE